MQAPNNGLQTLAAAGTVVTTTTTNLSFKNFGFNKFVAHLNVTAHSGTTPTLDVKFQDSPDGTTYTDIASAAFTQVTVTNSQTRLAVAGPIGKYLRAVLTTGGTTPSYTLGLAVTGNM